MFPKATQIFLKAADFSIGSASRQHGELLTGIRRKANLPTKSCIICNRHFAWRKKWTRDWANVKYCSERCRAARHRTVPKRTRASS